MRKLYLILARELNRVKIGLSNNPQQRLKQLQTSAPTYLELFAFTKSSAASIKEKALHEQFKDKKVIGEWFHLEPTDYIEILNKWNYDPGIHYSQRTKDNLSIGDNAFISWDGKSLCAVNIIDLDEESALIKIVKKIGRGISHAGDTHWLFRDEVRLHPLDALTNRVTS